MNPFAPVERRDISSPRHAAPSARLLYSTFAIVALAVCVAPAACAGGAASQPAGSPSTERGTAASAPAGANGGGATGGGRATSGSASAHDAASAPVIPPKRWLEWDHMTGDPGGARSALEDAGIRLDLFYNQTYGVNARGGADTTNATRHAGSYDLFLRFDLEQIIGLPEALTLVQVRGTWNNNVNAKVAALSDPFDDADGDEPVILNQLYHDQGFFDCRAALRIGYLDPQTIVDRNAYANSEDIQFMNTFLDNNNAIIPLQPGLGAALYLDPVDWLGFIIAAVDADARPLRTGFDTAFHDTGRFVGYFETDLKLRFPSPNGDLPGAYRAGVVFDPRPRPHFSTDDGDGNPLLDGQDAGFYLSFDQMLFREQATDDQGLGWFFRYGYRPKEMNRIDRFYSLGGQYKGPIPGRDRDVLGFGMYAALASEIFRRFEAPEFNGETGYELYYSIEVTRWFTLTPDIQFIQDPGGFAFNRDAIVFGIRGRLNL